MAKAKTVSNTKTVRKTNQVAVVPANVPVKVQEKVDSVAILTQAEQFALSEELTMRLAEALTEIQVLKKGSPALVIESEEQEIEARRLFTNYQTYLRNIETERKAAKVDILKAEKIIDGRAKVHSSVAELAKQSIETALKIWDAKQTAIANQKALELKKLHDQQVQEEAKRAEAAGEEPQSVMPMGYAEAPAKSVVVTTSSGIAKTQTWVDNWKWKIEGVPHPELLTADKAEQYKIPLSEFVLNVKGLDAKAKDKKSTIVIEGSLIIGFNDRYLR